MTITTKLLAIGAQTSQGTPHAIGQILPSGVRATVQLYLDGKIDQLFVKQERGGVVFILNEADTDQASALPKDRPLRASGMMTLEIIAPAPLSLLGLLLTEASH